jgi:hypothetical protein
MLLCGQVQLTRGAIDEARASARAASELSLPLMADPALGAEATRTVAIAWEDICEAEAAAGATAAALEAARSAAALHERLVREPSRVFPAQPTDQAAALCTLSGLLLETDQLEAAEAAAHDALDRACRAAGQTLPPAVGQLVEARARACRAAAAQARGDHAEAAEQAEHGLALLNSAATPMPPLRESALRITLLDLIAQAHAASGAHSAAADAAASALAQARARNARWPTARDTRPSFVALLRHAAALAAAVGRPDEAAAWEAESNAAQRSAEPPTA